MKIRRTLGIAALLAGTLTLNGCLGGSTEVVVVTGVYELQKVNGSALPFTFTNGVTITREVISINHDGTFTDVTTRADGTVVSDQGLYTNFSGTMSFADQTQGVVYQGFVSGKTLSVRFGAFTMDYLKIGEPSQ